jgi:hypothetical protein
MIISASRRTDIPAFYAEWFMNRIRDGYCTAPNPFNREQVSRISLLPQDVDVIVFWTRNPKPITRHLPELDDKGFRYYFQYTILDNPKALDPNSSPVAKATDTFQILARQIGPDRVVWRYDPIVLTTLTDVDFHLQKFADISSALRGYTHRVVISFVDVYKSIALRMHRLTNQGIHMVETTPTNLTYLTSEIAKIASENEMEIHSCAEKLGLQPYGVAHGKCIDYTLISEVFRVSVTTSKDPSQRRSCGCVISRDIGMYDTCPLNCIYCYATQSFDAVRSNRAKHDPKSPSLVDWYEPTSDGRNNDGQLKLPF